MVGDLYRHLTDFKSIPVPTVFKGTAIPIVRELVGIPQPLLGVSIRLLERGVTGLVPILTHSAVVTISGAVVVENLKVCHDLDYGLASGRSTKSNSHHP